jgi:hypothetical protein
VSDRTSTSTPTLFLGAPPAAARPAELLTVAQSADARIGELAGRLAVAEHQAAISRFEQERLRNRRSVRIATELAAIGTRPLPEVARRLRAAVEPVETPSPPIAPELPERSSEVADAVRATLDAEAGEQHQRFAHLRVLHAGPVCRFSGLAPHTRLDPARWREQVVEFEADLLLIEPPTRASWDPVPGGLGPVLAAARAAGIPSARIHLSSADREAAATGTGSRADLEVVEGAGDEALPLSVDTSELNPAGWLREPLDPVVVFASRGLGPGALARLAAVDPPVLLLHPPGLRPEGWEGRRKVVRTATQLHRLLRRCGVLLDHPDHHGAAAEQRRVWHAARACGLPIVAIDPPSVPTAAEGERLVGVLSVEHGGEVEAIHGVIADLDRRERLSIAGRRQVLSTADRETAFRELCARLAIPLPRPPRTTVVLSTHRPTYLDHAADSISRQVQPDVDVVVVLHGDAFDDHEAFDRFPELTAVVRAPRAWSFGDALNAGLDEATGELISKMDDDDHYGPHHLQDLVLAQRYSGADVVGKRIEFVHLAARDLTLRRAPGAVESDRAHVGGPTILATAACLQHHRFLRVPNRVDSTFYDRVLNVGGRIYRTHSRDVILERHGDAHAWEQTDDRFLDQAIAQRRGLDVGFASSDPADG